MHLMRGNARYLRGKPCFRVWVLIEIPLISSIILCVILCDLQCCPFIS